MSEKIHEYNSPDITVTYDVKRCIHAAECVRGLPNVFDPQRRPWVDPNATDADAIAEVVLRCPTGALHFQRHDQGAAEPIPDQNVISVAPNGPLYLRGNIAITDAEGTVTFQDTRVALCRCGASQNKPFCDNSHTQIDFHDDGTLVKNRLKAVDVADGTLRIIVAPNGPLMVQGPVEIHSADAATSFQGSKGALCRCGASASKPFCDGSHARIGFSAE